MAGTRSRGLLEVQGPAVARPRRGLARGRLERHLVECCAGRHGRGGVPAVALALGLPGRVGRGGGREPQARGHLVRLDLHDRPTLPLRGLPRPALEAADDHAAGALAQAPVDVLRLVPPDVHPEERRLAVLPAVGVPQPLADGEPEVGHREAGRRGPQLRVVGQVAHEGDLVVAHLRTPSPGSACLVRLAWFGLPGSACLLQRRYILPYESNICSNNLPAATAAPGGACPSGAVRGSRADALSGLPFVLGLPPHVPDLGPEGGHAGELVALLAHALDQAGERRAV